MSLQQNLATAFASVATAVNGKQPKSVVLDSFAGLSIALANAGKMVVVKSDGSGVELVNQPSAGSNITATSQLTNDSGFQTSAQVNTAITNAITAIVGAAPTTLDTLAEIATQLQADETGVAALVTTVSTKLSFTTANTLTAPQKLQVCTDIGVGDPTFDFATPFTAALV